MSTSDTVVQTFALLRTKLHMLIPRPCLVSWLNRGLDRRMTLVCTLSGCGKPTLLGIVTILTLLLTVLLPAPGYAQGGDETPPPAPLGQDLRFEHLTSEQGLSSNRVTSVIRDSRGFMWFGTFDGLNRYDGYEFKVFRHDPGDENSLSANFVVVLYQDRDGFLWVGTNGGGLNRYDPRTEQFTHYRHDAADPHTLSNDSVIALYQDRDGIIWIGTDGGGLNRYDPSIETFTRYPNDPDDPYSLSHNVVWTILEDERGVLWVGTDGGGLNRFDQRSQRFTTYQHDPEDPHSLSDDSVLALAEGLDGKLWIGTRGSGLDQFDPGEETFAHFHNPDDPSSLSHNSILDLSIDRLGTLWIGTGGGGLNQFDVETERFSRYQPDPNDPYGLNHNHIKKVYADPSGLLWLATVGGGVNLVDLERKPFTHYHSTPGDPNSLSSNDISEIHEDREGVLWLGTGGGGLNRLARQTMQYNHYVHDPNDPHSLSDNLVRAIVEDGDGVLWLATRGGLNRFDPQTEQFTAYHSDLTNDTDAPTGLLGDSVWSLHLDAEGMLWIGTSLGLNRLDPRSDHFLSYEHNPDDPHSLSGNTVTVIHEDRSGALWFGTLGDGLNRFDRETERFTRYRHDPDDPQSLGGNTVWTIHEDADGVLWIGTSAGLDRHDPDERQFTHYGEQDGLPGGGVMSVLEDDNPLEKGGPNLWLSTSSGLYTFNPQSKALRHYDAEDGLQGNEFRWSTAFKSASGELFFGGSNGLTAFYPDQIQDSPHIPPVFLTDFQLANKPVEIGGDSVLQESISEAEHLTVAHQDRVLSFEFAALGYRAPEKNRYRYMLENFDEDWTEVGSDRRFVTYTNLDPGEYVFRVTGSNSDGVWNDEGTSLKITITPPWWETTWFRGGLILLMVGVVVTAYRLRVGSLEGRSRELQTQVTDRTHELNERVRELNCLYGISRLAGRQGVGLEEVLQGAVELLPAAWQYAEIACARITLNGKEFRTTNFSETAWRQSATIRVHGAPAGTIDVCYLEERPQVDEGPFLEGERALLGVVAGRLGRISERIQAAQALQRTRDELSTLLAVSRELVSTLDLEPLLNLVLDALKTVVDYDVGTIRRLVQGNMELQAHRWLFPREGWPSQRLPVANIPIIREMVQTRQAILVDDHKFNPAIVGDTEFFSDKLSGEVLQASRTLMAVPLVAKDEVIGMLVLGHHQPNRWGEEAKELAQAFANQAAVAIINAELYEQAGAAATLAERTRLARELHDSATQALYSAALFSEAGKELAEAGDIDSAQHYLSRVGEVVHQALKDIRLLVYQLRPPVLEKEGLVMALQHRLDAVEKRAGMDARLICDRLVRFSDPVSEELYGITLEALNNVLKHADADTVTLTIRSDEGGVDLEVRDNGRGFDPEVAYGGGGMGLVTMAERAAKIDAALTIDSSLDQGSSIRVIVPSSGIRR